MRCLTLSTDLLWLIYEQHVTHQNNLLPCLRLLANPLRMVMSRKLVKTMNSFLEWMETKRFMLRYAKTITSYIRFSQTMTLNINETLYVIGIKILWREQNLIREINSIKAGCRGWRDVGDGKKKKALPTDLWTEGPAIWTDGPGYQRTDGIETEVRLHT